MRQFKSEEHRSQRCILIGYKVYRRNGMCRERAVEMARARHQRLSASFAVMNATDWKADPIAVARNAVGAEHRESFSPVAKITQVDEYGPMIDWTTHWVDLRGKTLYVKDDGNA